MATLEKIRKKAGLLVTVVGLALLAFIIGDLLNSGSSLMHKNQNNVMTVNGKSVDYQEFMSRENELSEVYKLQMGQSSLPEEYMAQVRQNVYNNIVEESVLYPCFEKLGIEVTPEEMDDMVEGENISPVLQQMAMFQNPQTGAFDKNAVVTFLNQIKNMDSYPPETQAQLAQAKSMWMFWEKNIKRNRLNEKYSTLLGKAVVANSIDAKDAFDNSAESSDIVYVMQPFGTVDSTVNVPASEIEKLYNERKEMFRQSETCVIDYIAVDIVPSQEDYDKASKEMDAIRAELETTDNVVALTNEKSDRQFIDAYFSLNGFTGDDEVKNFVSHAQVGTIEGPVFKNDMYRVLKLVDRIEAPDSVKVAVISFARQSEAETKNFADSLLDVIKQGGDFSALAKQYSGDQFAENGGEIGWMTEVGAMSISDDFKKTVFTLPAGQSSIVKLNNTGTMIVKVLERTAIVPKYKVADIQYSVSPSSATRSKIYNDLNQFIAKNNSAEKMEAAAKEAGYDLVPNVRVTAQDMTVGMVPNSRQVIRWAFNNKKGDISDINECDNKYFVVAAHKGRLPEGYQSLQSVTPQLKAELAAKKKGEEIAAGLKAKNLSSIASYAEAMNATPDTVKFITMSTSRITNIGMEPKLNAMIAGASLNQVSEPLVGENGVYVFQVVNRVNNGATFDAKQQSSMLEANNEYRLGNMAFRYMFQNAKIDDNRVRFY